MSDFKERNEHFARAMTDAQVSYIEAERAACDLEAENVQLRELCKELAEFLTEAEWLQWPELRAEMQRLGVEVAK